MASSSLNVLVIEDNEPMSEMTKDHLESRFAGAAVTVYDSGTDALEKFRSTPDVIILDYQLDSRDSKALNGIQVLMQLKKKFKAPVICLSAQEKPEVAASLIKAGAHDYIVKNREAFNKLEASIKSIIADRSGKDRKKTNRIIFLVVGILLLAALAIIFSR